MTGLQRPPTAHDDRPCTTARKPGAAIRLWPSRAAQVCWKGIVRLPGSQPLLLRQIERSLLAEDFRLDSEFAIFARSSRGREMPSAEQIPSWFRSLRAAGMPAAGLAAAGGAVVLGWLIMNQRQDADHRAGPATT